MAGQKVLDASILLTIVSDAASLSKSALLLLSTHDPIRQLLPKYPLILHPSHVDLMVLSILQKAVTFNPNLTP